LRIALERGRIFRDGEEGVALISSALAHRRWPDQDPIGKRYEGVTIIGVIADARTVRISEHSATECYLPIEPSQLAPSW
jgi:hypothetical protein